jgi:hypothetical protein
MSELNGLVREYEYEHDDDCESEHEHEHESGLPKRDRSGQTRFTYCRAAP